MKIFSKLQLLGIFLIILTINSCLSPEQVDGLCRQCGQDQILSYGSCYAKIHKCQFQEKDICFECETDYTFFKDQCNKIKKSLKSQEYNADEHIDESKMLRRGLQLMLLGGQVPVDQSSYSSTQFLSVISTIQQYYPTFSTTLMTKALYQIVSGTNYFIYFKFPNSTDVYQVCVYVYYAFYGLPNQIKYIKKNGSIISLPSPIVGGITILSSTKYSVQPFLSVQKYLKIRYPTFSSTLISKVQYQAVSGTIYTVYFKLPNLLDSYEVKIVVPVGTASLISTYYYISIKVNGVSVAI